jgi:hypothetical protein
MVYDAQWPLEITKEKEEERKQERRREKTTGKKHIELDRDRTIQCIVRYRYTQCWLNIFFLNFFHNFNKSLSNLVSIVHIEFTL